MVVQFGDVADALELVSSTALGVELALHEAIASDELPEGSAIEVVETAGRSRDAVATDVQDLATDPSTIAAFVAPFVDAPAAVQALLDAGVPVVSLSGAGPSHDPDRWRSLVPTTSLVGNALVVEAMQPACVAGESAATTALAEEVRRSGFRSLSPDPEVAGREADGCADVIWLGDADGAAALRASLGRAGAGEVGVIVSLAARASRLATEGYPAMVGTRAIGPCVPLLTSAEPEAQRFVHAFQATHGIPPGPCAAEGYAAASRIVEGLEDKPTRQGARAAVASMFRLRTAGGVIMFGADGSPTAPGPARERVVGVRWLPDASA